MRTGFFRRKEDTIFASASGVGKAAIAVFRVSGSGCAYALKSLAPGPELPHRTATVRKLRYPNTLELIDTALITRFRSPHSFTGEDLLELHVTGGRAVCSATVAALSQVRGLRPAEAGEFAWRAFLNGKIDLSQVEGLGPACRRRNRSPASPSSADCRWISAARVRSDSRTDYRGDGSR